MKTNNSRTIDKFGHRWDLPKNELCSTCGQPDSCGDCNHQPLTRLQVDWLGGIPAGLNCPSFLLRNSKGKS